MDSQSEQFPALVDQLRPPSSALPEQQIHTAENRLSFRRQDLEAVLNNIPFNPSSLIGLFEKDYGSEYAASAGVWEGYTIKEHTLMVMGQFEKYFSNSPLPAGIDKNLFRTMLALHDIGKPEAIRSGGKHLQHEYTAKIMNSILSELGYSQQEKNLALALVSGDSIGDSIKTGNIQTSAAEIVKAARVAGVPPEEFFDLLTIFYRVDAGSYTEDAGGKRSLDSLFEFDKERKQLRFSPQTNATITRLKAKVQSLSLPASSPSQISKLPPEKAKGKVASIASGIRKVFEKLKTQPSQQKQSDSAHDKAPIKPYDYVDSEIEDILARWEEQPPDIKRARQEQYEKEQLSEPVIAYHGTPEDFEEFKPGQLSWFTESLSEAFVPRVAHTRKFVKLVELHIAHPFHHIGAFDRPYYIQTVKGQLDYAKKYKALGYDGATFEDHYFGRVWIPFDNKQIKVLATSVEGRSLDEIAKYFNEQIAKREREGKVMLPGEMTKKLDSLYTT